MHTAKRSTFRKFEFLKIDVLEYQAAWDFQKLLFEKRVKNEINDLLILLEHPHTYTLGKIADKNNLLGDENYLREKNVSVFEIDRGGDITYHGPGQVVGYPIINLKEWKTDTHLYLRGLEDVVINVCKQYGLNPSRKNNLTGVWIDDRKICAIGIKVSRWVTMHGFAFNVTTDLSYFSGIIPCGIKNKFVTSLQKELGKEVDIDEVKEKILDSFKEVFDYDKYVQANESEFQDLIVEKEKGI